MLVLTSNKRQTGFVWVFLLAVLLLTPLFWLNQLLDELRVKDENSLDIQARERLINEMADYQDRFRPDKHLAMALEDMRCELGLENPEELVRPLSPAANQDPMLIRNYFPARASAFLKAKYNILPLLIIAVDCDMQHIFSWYSQKLFLNETQRYKFEEAATYWLVFGQREVVNELASTKDLRLIKASQRSLAGDPSQNAHSAFTNLFNEHISVFSSPPSTPGVCRTFFSNRFGSQRSYQISHLVTRKKGNSVSMLASYYAIFNSADISPTSMLKHSFQSTDQDLDRFIVKSQIKQPYFDYIDDHLLYFTGFPAHYFTLIEDYAIKNPNTRKLLAEFVNQHALAVKIDKRHLQSPYALAQKICTAVIKIAVLFFFALLVRSFMSDLEQSMKLAKKLRIAVAIIVLLPISGFFLLSEQIQTSSGKMELIKYQTIIKQRLDLLDKIINETDPRLVLIMQGIKARLADAYFGLNENSTSSGIKRRIYPPAKAALVEVSLDREGERIVSNRKGSQKDNATLRIGLYAILSDLGAINRDSAEIKTIHKHQLFMAGLAGSLMNLFANPEALARESLLTDHILSASALSRSSHQLIAHPSRPMQPVGIVLQFVDDLNVFLQLYKQLNRQSLRLFSDYDNICQIDYALALRGSDALRGMQVPYDNVSSSKTARLAANALQRRTSSTSIQKINGLLRINSWIYTNNSPVVIVATATLKPDVSNQLLFWILPWALLVYAFLAVTLISDVLADIFLAPVNALLELVTRLRSNDLSAKVAISSGDEFEELGNSFNKMSEGLRQREKMRRFVSERLFASLESDDADNRSGKISISVISSDIRGFTALSEQHAPEEIVSLLNDYFSCMEEALGQHGGSIEKIVGDAITAAFYPDPELPFHSVRACQAAKAMKKSLQKFNQDREQNNRFSIENGIGVASGEAVMGFTKSDARRREFILLGDVMQRAEHLESMTRWGKSSNIFIDQTTAKMSGQSVEPRKIGVERDETIYLELIND
ncbi:MAG: HAMP domain-containing protein [Candidatus Riflebacteria bacterium]|nr:HAMP domain-containing protein [Candidatus Riflebacteria bacterium]